MEMGARESSPPCPASFKANTGLGTRTVRMSSKFCRFKDLYTLLACQYYWLICDSIWMPCALPMKELKVWLNHLKFELVSSILGVIWVWPGHHSIFFL